MGVLRPAALFLSFGLCSLLAHEANQLDCDLRLFTVMSAWIAAQPEAPAGPLGQAIRQELARKSLTVLPRLRNFVSAHRKTDLATSLSPFISFALVSKGPPDFGFTLQSNELPPDVDALEGFQGLLKTFYEEAEMEELWRRAQPAIERLLGHYQPAIIEAMNQANGYLRHIQSGSLGRRFQIVVDPVGPPGISQSRQYKDDYYVVLTWFEKPSMDEVLHVYLHYLVDPMVMKYAEQLEKKKPLIDFAQGAPLLGENYKSDFVLLTTECLIKALEACIRRQETAALVDRAVKEGFILTLYFHEALAAYEKQEQSLRFFLPEMLEGIDLRKETARLEKVEFARARASAPRAAAPRALKPAEEATEQAERLYSERKLEEAKAGFRQVLEMTDEKPLRARAHFGLARVAVLEKNPALAEELFRKTLELEPDAYTRAWTLVYLGRLEEAAGQRETAARHYRAALEVEGAPPGARKAAEEALAKWK